MPLKLRAKMAGSAFTLLRIKSDVRPEMASMSDEVVIEEAMSADSVGEVALMSEELLIEEAVSATVALLPPETTLTLEWMDAAAGEINLDMESINGTSSAVSHSVIESAKTTSAHSLVSAQISLQSPWALNTHRDCALDSAPSTGAASVLPSMPRWSSAASGVVVREALRQAVGNPSVLVGWEVSNQSSIGYMGRSIHFIDFDP